MKTHKHSNQGFTKAQALTLFSVLPIFVLSPIHAETGNFALLNVGFDNEAGNLLDAYIDLSLTEVLRMNVGVGESTTDTSEGEFTTKQTQLSLSGSHAYTEKSAISWAAGFQTWGKTKAIETQDTIISVGYFFPNQWHTSLDYETGELELFTKEAFSNQKKSLSSDRDAWRLTIDYTHKTGFTWIRYLKRNYEQTLSLISERRILQRIIKNIALDQAFALSKEEINLGYEWLLDTLDVGIDYNHITSVIDNQKNQYASIYTRHYIGQNLILDFRIEQEIDDNFTVLTAGIGLAW